MATAVRIATGDPRAGARSAQLDLARDVAEALARRGGQAIGQAGTGTGKALALDTPIPTPSGWTTMGRLVVGDLVFGEDGMPVRVAAVHPVRTDRKCFRLRISDGTSIVSDAGHLWPTAPDADAVLSRTSVCAAVRESYAMRDEGGDVDLVDLYEDCRGAVPFGVLAQAAGVPVAQVLALDLLERAAGATLESAGSAERLARLARTSVAESLSVVGMARLAGVRIDPREIGPLTVQEVEGLAGRALPMRVMVDPVALLDEAVALMEAGDLGELDRIVVRTEDIARRTRPTLLVPTLPLVLPQARLPIDPYVLGRRLASTPDAGAIPVRYLRASALQRLALLQGAMDVAGTVPAPGEGSGACGFAHRSPSLTVSVLHLLSTLGLRATPSRYASTTHLAFRADGLAVFRDPAKASALALLPAGEASGPRVVSIREEPPCPVRCITVDNRTGVFLAGATCVPTHNSLAYLVPAALAAATDGTRTVVSTESLSLQAQIVDKDAPVAVRAVSHSVPGSHVKVAVLKGWSNHACLPAARESAREILGAGADDMDDEGRCAALRARGGDRESLIAWAIAQYADPASPGDRHSYTGTASAPDWAAVSVSPAECRGVSKCPVGDDCKAARAKLAAAAADIVVTNHTLLAVEAAKGIPAVTGSRTLGDFDAIIMDEAHAMPDQVRNQGAGEVSGPRVRSLVRALLRTVDATAQEGAPNPAASLAQAGEAAADLVDATLSGRVRGADPVRIDPREDPTAGFGPALEAWLREAASLIVTATGAHREDVKVKRTLTRFSAAADALREVSTHTPGVARWVEPGRDGSPACLRYSPVSVQGALRRNLWSAPTVGGGEGEDTDLSEDAGPTDAARHPLSVVAVSATLPTGFARDMGLDASMREFPSPFDAARAASALFVPRAVEAADVGALSRPGARRPSLDTTRHPAWAAPILCSLARANGGRALILAAKAADGRAYAERLRATLGEGIHVLDQWSGLPLRQLVATWRDDERAVLVGTRSLMTGVDAPGDTCSLVVIDRVPRSPSSPVDDARVEDVMATRRVDKWGADREVYVADAALRLAQASGRLIRSQDDRGMVAVLDPRLLGRRGSAFSYPPPTRRAYLDALGEWGRRISVLDAATDFLRGLRS